MHSIKYLTLIGLIIWGLVMDEAFPQGRSAPLIIDHTYTDISQLSDALIDRIQSHIWIHYAHTSHGSQITEGLLRLEDKNNKYDIAIDYSNLPTQTDVLCIFDGQESETYITPDLYWESSSGVQLTRNVLDHNPTINISMWTWCCQLDDYNTAETQRYLDTMAALEVAYPNITFVYMTGNAQSESSNRYDRNNQIRQYCAENNKVLFDFADLDCWYNGQKNIVNGIPCEHPRYQGDQAGHTTYESCENKAKAFWYLLAQLVEEQFMPVGESNQLVPQEVKLEQNYPNPFNPSTRINYNLSKPTHVILKIYNIRGQEIKTLVNGFQTAGMKFIVWNGLDGQGQKVSSGIYIYLIDTSDFSSSKKMVMVQ